MWLSKPWDAWQTASWSRKEAELLQVRQQKQILHVRHEEGGCNPKC